MHIFDPITAAHRAVHDQTVMVYGTDVKIRRLLETPVKNVYGEENPNRVYGQPESTKAVVRFPEQSPALGHKSLFIEEFLPVEAEFKYEDDVKIGDQIEVDYLFPSGRRQRIFMDVVDTKTNSARSEAAGIVWVLAPVRQ